MFELFSSNAAIIACMAIGILLIVVEALTPGLGLPGLAGSAMLIVGSVLVWFNYGLTAGLITLLCALVFSSAAVLLSLRSAAKGKLSKAPIVLDDKTASPEAVDLSQLVGHSGTAVTPLNPVGTALIDGKKLDVLSADGFIAKDAQVCVTCTEGSKIYVSKLN